jgi:hypothetical protein
VPLPLESINSASSKKRKIDGSTGSGTSAARGTKRKAADAGGSGAEEQDDARSPPLDGYDDQMEVPFAQEMPDQFDVQAGGASPGGSAGMQDQAGNVSFSTEGATISLVTWCKPVVARQSVT